MKRGLFSFFCILLLIARLAYANTSSPTSQSETEIKTLPSFEKALQLNHAISILSIKVTNYFQENAYIQDYLVSEKTNPQELPVAPSISQKLFFANQERKKNILEQLDRLYEQITTYKTLVKNSHDEYLIKEVERAEHSFNKILLEASFVHYLTIKPMSSGILRFFKSSKSFEVDKLIDRAYAKNHFFSSLDLGDVQKRASELLEIYNPLAKDNNDAGNATKPIYTQIPNLHSGADEKDFFYALIDRQRFQEENILEASPAIASKKALSSAKGSKKICTPLFDSLAN